MISIFWLYETLRYAQGDNYNFVLDTPRAFPESLRYNTFIEEIKILKWV